MGSELLNELVAVNLRYAPGAKPLRIRAIAQLAAKVLYTLRLGQTEAIDQLEKDIAATVSIPVVPVVDVIHALDLLANLGLAESDGDRWRLSSKGIDQIENDLNRSRMLVESVLDRHFPQALQRKPLHNWFQETCTEYFGQYGTRWAASIFRVPTSAPAVPSSWKDTILITAKATGMAPYVDALTSGFTGFIQSTDSRDRELLWGIAQAMLAARLIASAVGADPITTRELRDSRVLLDTNILVVAALEAHWFSPWLASLRTALKDLNIRLAVLPSTEKEYERVVARARENTMRAVARYSLEVIGQAADPFAGTALIRGCTTVEDFERFFDEVGKIPVALHDEEIEICEDASFMQAADIGSNDVELQRKIAEAWRTTHHNDKRANALVHDAGLLHAVEEAVARGQRCWVLTTDYSMTQLSARRSGDHTLPSWVTLDALVQILAVDLAGYSVRAEDFAPLLAAALANEAYPMADTYTIEDLAWLLDIEERCADLPPDRVKSCAVSIARARLAGMHRNDPEVVLSIQRAFQADRLGIATDLSTAKLDLAVARKELEYQSLKRQGLEETLITERTDHLRGEAWKSFWWKSILASLWILACFTASIWLGFQLVGQTSVLLVVGIPTALLSLGLAGVRVLWKLVGTLRQSLASAPDRAKLM